MKRACLLIVVLQLVFVFSACAKGDQDLKIAQSSSGKTLIELTSVIYEEQQLNEIVSFGKLDDLNEHYPIECVRKRDGIYRVSYLGGEQIAVVTFDVYGNKISGKVYSAQLSKAEFDAVKAGQTLSDVQALDSDGDYLFLYSGRNDLERISYHYSKDGYLISIKYDTDNTILSVTEELI